MIGITQGCKHKISDHVGNLVQNREALINELNVLKLKLSEDLNKSKNDQDNVKNDMERVNKELEEIKQKFAHYVDVEQIEELITDIRQSFEIFMNTTPRQKDDEFDNKMNAMQKQLNFMETQMKEMKSQMDSLFSSGEVEVIPASAKSSKKSVPKLELKKK